MDGVVNGSLNRGNVQRASRTGAGGGYDRLHGDGVPISDSAGMQTSRAGKEKSEECETVGDLKFRFHKGCFS